MPDPKLIYLQNREMLVASFQEESDALVWVVCPVQIQSISTQKEGMIGETFMFRPWLSLSGDRKFLIAKKDILTFANVTSKIADQYDNFVNEYYYAQDNLSDEIEELENDEEDEFMKFLQEQLSESKKILH
jgi:ABC-type uncharacterized transport system YnjBCD substrate-binding protein